MCFRFGLVYLAELLFFVCLDFRFIKYIWKYMSLKDVKNGIKTTLIGVSMMGICLVNWYAGSFDWVSVFVFSVGLAFLFFPDDILKRLNKLIQDGYKDKTGE
jgi:hypothetical protein